MSFQDKKEERPTIVLGLTLKGMQVYEVRVEPPEPPNPRGLVPHLQLTRPLCLQEVNRTPQLLHDLPWPRIGKLAVLVRVCRV